MKTIVKHQLSALTAIAMLIGATATAVAADLTIWWPKGFVEAEDHAMRAVVAEYEKSGKKVELSIFTQDDLPVKIQAAISAGAPPDLSMPIAAGARIIRWALDGELADLSPIIEPMEDRFISGALPAAKVMNQATGKRGYHLFPALLSTQQVHVWRPLLAQAGYSDADIPRGWTAFWSFWCDKVQPALRRSGTANKLYAFGLPVSTSNLDTRDQLDMFMLAHGVDWMDESGALTLDQAEVRAGITAAIGEYAQLFRKGCIPSQAVSWKAVDNNLYFNNQTIAATINTSLSIPLSHLAKRPDNYYQHIVTIPMPDRRDGGPMPMAGSNFVGLIAFERGAHREEALAFIRWLVTDGRLDGYIEATGGRLLPTLRASLDSPFWRDAADPHRQFVLRYLASGAPPFVNRYVRDYRAAEVAVADIWPKALTRVALDGWSPEKAVDEAIARTKEIMLK